jgi:hypothetical protein
VMRFEHGMVGIVGSAEVARRARAFEAMVGAMKRGSAEWARAVLAAILIDVIEFVGWWWWMLIP